MIRHLAITLLFFSLITSGEPLTNLYSFDDFQKLSESLTKAIPQAKASTVCIELEGGGSGSGVIVSPEGLLLTAAHVSQKVGQQFEVVLADGSRYPAIALGLNTSTDAAMAKILPAVGHPAFPFSPLSTKSELRQYVFSLGHSGGLDLERGIVARLARILEITPTSMKTDGTLIGGDSGGPLFDLQGNLIGIHSRVGKLTNSNTHIPIDNYKNHWEDLLNRKLWGDSTYAHAGLLFQGMRLLEQDEALQIFSVDGDSPSDAAGVRAGDLLVEVRSSPTQTLKALMETLASQEAPEQVTNEINIVIRRLGEDLNLTLTIDE